MQMTLQDEARWLRILAQIEQNRIALQAAR